MAKAATARKKVDDFSDRLESIRSMMQGLMKEAVQNYNPLHIDCKKGINFYDAVERYEYELIKTALHMCDGRQKDAAKLLKMATSTLCMKMKKLKIPANPAKV